MSNDPYLRPGLTPNTDVELYASEAAGGTNHTRTFSVTATGVASVSRVVFVNLATTATGTATVARTATLAREFAVTTTGVATVTTEATAATPPPSGGSVRLEFRPSPPPLRLTRRSILHAEVRARPRLVASSSLALRAAGAASAGCTGRLHGSVTHTARSGVCGVLAVSCAGRPTGATAAGFVRLDEFPEDIDVLDLLGLSLV